MSQTLRTDGINTSPKVCVFHGLSTDDKPIKSFTESDASMTTFIGNGSVFYEMDTNKKYLYDKSTETWRG